jgi:hypothetical protein
MKPTLSLSILLTLAATSVVADQSPHWHPDLTRACEVARQEQKPIFLVFRCVR